MDKNTLFISDLDGTLLNKSAKLSDYTKETLNALIHNGMNFSVATARLLSPVKKMLNGVDVSVPVILMNGVLIYDLCQDVYVKVEKLPSNSVVSVIKTIRKFQVSSFMCELNDEFKTYHEVFVENPPDEYVKERIARYYKDYIHSEGFPKEISIILFFLH